MTEEDYLERINQADYDLYYLRKRIKKLEVETAEAVRQRNIPLANLKRRYRRQQERYVTYAKFYKKTFNAQYQEMLKGAKGGRNDIQA